MGIGTRMVDFVRFHGTAGMRQKLGKTTHHTAYLLRLADDKRPEVRVAALRRMRHAGKLIMAESAVEPPHLNASSINIWQYRESDGFIPEIIGIGHADSATCRRVSLLFYGAYLGSSTILEESNLGTGFVRVSDRRKDEGEEENEIGRRISEMARERGIPKAFAQFLLSRVASFPMRSQGRLAATLSELGRYESEIGLVAVHSGQLQARREVLSRIEEEVKKAQRSGRPKILRYQEEGTDEIMILPFFLFSPTGVGTLVFKGGEKLFVDHPSFPKLSKFHRQRLLAEMREDAERRKMIYQLWKSEDEKTQQSLAKRLTQMTDAEKNEETITIGGVRDYERARTVASLEPHKISPLEYATVHLPQMLQSDEVWIKRMEAILEDVKREEKPGGKIDQINRAILIDAFLRGSTPTFAETDEERVLFETWKGARSKSVWKTLSRICGTKDLRRILSQENVFFKVELQEGRLVITPYAVVNRGDFVAVVDLKKKVVQYLDWWSHRDYQFHKLKGLGPAEEKQLASFADKDVVRFFKRAEGEAQAHFKEGVRLLPLSKWDIDRIDRIKDEWEYALMAHPEGAASLIIGYCWKNFYRDTAALFRELTEKVEWKLQMPRLFGVRFNVQKIDVRELAQRIDDQEAARMVAELAEVEKPSQASPFEKMSLPERVVFLVRRGDSFYKAFEVLARFINYISQGKRFSGEEKESVSIYNELVSIYNEFLHAKRAGALNGGFMEGFDFPNFDSMYSINRVILKERLSKVAWRCFLEALSSYNQSNRINMAIENPGQRLSEPRERLAKLYFEGLGYYKKALEMLYSDPQENPSPGKRTFDAVLKKIEPLLLRVIAYARVAPDRRTLSSREYRGIFFTPEGRVIKGVNIDRDRIFREITARLKKEDDRFEIVEVNG